LSADRVDELPALTGVRFLFAAWVVAHHAEKLVVEQSGLPLLSTGYLGVDGFFMLSGLILTHVYRRQFERAGGLPLWTHFLWLRLARIWPAYLTALFICAALEIVRARYGSGALVIDPEPWLWELVRHAVMIQSWGLGDYGAFNVPGWTVSAEWGAYVTFPLFLVATRRLAGVTWPSLAAIALSFLALYAFYRWVGAADLDQPGPGGMVRLAAEFFAGVLLRGLMPTTAAGRRRGDAALVMGLAGTVLALTTVGRLLPLGEALMLPFLALLLWGCMAGGPWALRIFGNPAMLFLGAASYSIYLIQSPVTSIAGFLAARWPPLQWLPAFVLMVLAGTMAAGCLLYLLVGRPARAWLRRLA
jgi:peptidoglycan/LPS O-acetylase OafA/YrhL